MHCINKQDSLFVHESEVVVFVIGQFML